MSPSSVDPTPPRSTRRAGSPSRNRARRIDPPGGEAVARRHREPEICRRQRSIGPSSWALGRRRPRARGPVGGRRRLDRGSDRLHGHPSRDRADLRPPRARQPPRSPGSGPWTAAPRVRWGARRAAPAPEGGGYRAREQPAAARAVLARSGSPSTPTSARREYRARQRQQVREVTILGRTRAVNACRTFRLPAVEHCREEIAHVLYLDAVTGAAVPTRPSSSRAPATRSRTRRRWRRTTVVILPEQRASFVVRQLLGKMLKPVQADWILEESFTLEKIDLYYRPGSGVRIPLEAQGQARRRGDGRGDRRRPPGAAPDEPAGPLRETRCSTSGRTRSLLIPGGSIAIKVARAALDKSY